MSIIDLNVDKCKLIYFAGFLKDQYTILPEVEDRCFCTVVTCKYDYESTDVDFNIVW